MKTSMPNSVESFGYVNYCTLSNPKTVKLLSSSIGYNCQKICSWSRRRKTILKIWKKARLFQCINKSIIYRFFKDFSNARKKTNSSVVFSFRTFPKILNYMDHQWDLPTINKTQKQDSNRHILDTSYAISN